MKPPELLLPAGNIESFFAGLEGGADAFYLGLRSFNARNRAKNFTINQLQALLKVAEKEKKAVYVTLNTLIKNQELNELLDMLYLMSQTSISALIIQDWGVFYLVKKHFPQLELHASTQMTNHNSLGGKFSHKLGFERIILARELTYAELAEISRKNKIELEIFVHGSLCYAFSGMCFFSSYLGGMSANRGSCRQPCRRKYQHLEAEQYFFNLKDLQLLDWLPKIIKLGIRSLKIEGRMKPPEYVYQVARAYRMALDDPQKIPAAKEILQQDLGRDKTSYFLGGTIQKAINEKPYTGILVGNIDQIDSTALSFRTFHPLQLQDRIRLLPQDGTNTEAIKIKKMQVNGKAVQQVQSGEIVRIEHSDLSAQKGDLIFLTNRGNLHFRKSFAQPGKKLKYPMSAAKKKHILSRIGSQKWLNQTELAVRIDTIKWIRKIDFRQFRWLILNLTKSDWNSFDWNLSILQKFRHKIIIELPSFIAESDLSFFLEISKKAQRNGFHHFMLSHLSQAELFSPNVQLSTNEHVYLLNDAAIQFVKERKIQLYSYSIETDFPNLLQGKDRKGLMPLYLTPSLFTSRMPVQLDQDNPFRDISEAYRYFVRDGISYVLPMQPVSFLQYRKKLEQKGFRRFILDFSFQAPSRNKFQAIIKKFNLSEAVQPASVFNFKLGLK